MKKTNQLIMGSGHRIKSLANPGQRVEIFKDYARTHFKSTPILDFALGVEQLTARERADIFLNVGSCIAVSFVDMVRSCGAFTREGCDGLMSVGTLRSSSQCS
jgi:ATP citrate (pro-S)-lyase